MVFDMGYKDNRTVCSVQAACLSGVEATLEPQYPLQFVYDSRHAGSCAN